MKKILLLVFVLLFFGISNVFSATITKSWNNNNVNCDSLNDNNGAKYIAKNIGWEKGRSGNFKCEKHGFYSGDWYGWYSKNTIHSCPDNRFVSKIQWSGNNYKIYCKRKDDTPPSESELIPNPAYGSYFVANDNKTISYTTFSSESPIVEINTTLEKYNNKNSSNSLKFDTSNNFKKYNNNLSLVDIDKNSKNYRPYTFHLGKVCDEAGNCKDFNKNYYYNVYANDVDFPGNSIISSTDNLSNGTKLADGTINNVQLVLKDKYNNKILKVTKADNTVIRNVDVNVNYNNALYLDQYKQSGEGAVYIGTTNLNGTDTPNSGIFRNQANGIYNLDFKVYSPTTNTYDKAKGTFKINNITAGVSDFGGNKTFASNIEFKFKPIYKLNFKNEGAKKYGFVEGVLQDGGLEYFKDGTSTTGNENIYLEFGKYKDGQNRENTDFNLKLIEPGNTYSIVEGHQININNLTKKDFGDFNFSSKLEQENTAIVSYDLTYLASFIKYNINGKTIAYPTDIIGKMTYSSGTGTNTNEVKGVKVLGKTYSIDAKNIFKNQELDYNLVVGKLSKGELRKKVRKRSYNIINNIDLDYYTSTDNNYKELLNNKLIYYKLNGGEIKYSNINSNYKAKDGKTILIIGGDLIIDQNIINSGISAIIVLKNQEGKGGNILIDDDVLNINAIIYTDKAIFPYALEKGRIINLDDGIKFFKNQLYIKGSIFSNNTIGGARGTNLKCAYYETATCNTKEAQKYDLNFLRRYSRYVDDNDTPYDTSDDFIEISEGGSQSIGIPEQYLDYPLVIEYNPLIQITPPPLFDN